MVYDCKKCGKIFKQKSNYTYHIGRIRPCIREDISIKDSITTNDKNDKTYDKTDKNMTINEENKYRCIHCDKKYKNPESLSRHKKIHKEENTRVSIKDEKILILEKKVEELEIMIREKTINKQIIKQQNNKNITNNNIIISFGKEDINKLTRLEMKKILQNNDIDEDSNPLLRVIEKMHFNNNIPEQKNIKMNNIKSKYIDIYDNNRWKKESLDTTIDNILDNHTFNLVKIISELDYTIDKKITRLSEYYVKMYSEYIKLQNNNLEYEDDEDIEKRNKEIKTNIKDIIEKIKMLLYNKTKEIHNKKIIEID